MTAAIEIVDLRKSYGDFKAVDGISLSIEHGEIYAILGPNGAGKTTIINMLTGFLPPSSGNAYVKKKIRELCARFDLIAFRI